MPDWTKPMEQTFEYYTVDPNTLADVKRLDTVKSASFSYDSESETLGSATIDINEPLGEEYVRCYLKTIQNGITEKHPIGTVLVQTPSFSFNGVVKSVSADCYTPLIELKEKKPPLGYAIRKGKVIMDEAYDIVSKNVRVPVTKMNVIDGESKILYNNFVSNTDETWVKFVIDLIDNANCELGLTEKGNIFFKAKQDLESMQPIWTYNDDNSSILLPDITVDNDIFGIPNVVEVMYSYGSDCKYARVVNDDPNSPISTVNRGREIPYRDTNANLSGYATQEQVNDYAERLLKARSTIQYTVSYSHAYCPVRVGDCVRLNYTRAGIKNVKAKVISQSIKCEPGCRVSEKAVFISKLWR
jgi:hypothetical protein